MATVRKTSKGPALDLSPPERAGFAERVTTRMEELGFNVRDAARETTLSPATIRAWFRDSTGTTTVTLWALVAVCLGLDIELAEVVADLGVTLEPKAVDTASRNWRDRRGRNGLNPNPPKPRKASTSASTPTSGGQSLVGDRFREAIEAIVDERVEQRLAEILSQ